MAGAWERDQVARWQGDADHVNAVARENQETRKHSKELEGERTIQDIELTTGQKMPWHKKILHVTSKFLRFVGPGILISVAYIDPDNFQANVAAGAEFKFKLLFMILLGNLISVFLQVCISGLCLRFLDCETLDNG